MFVILKHYDFSDVENEDLIEFLNDNNRKIDCPEWFKYKPSLPTAKITKSIFSQIDHEDNISTNIFTQNDTNQITESTENDSDNLNSDSKNLNSSMFRQTP